MAGRHDASRPPDTNYSTPVTKVVGGEAQLIFGGADGKLWGFQPRTGKPLWNFPLSRRSINASPMVVGNIGLLRPQRRESRRQHAGRRRRGRRHAARRPGRQGEVAGLHAHGRQELAGDGRRQALGRHRRRQAADPRSGNGRANRPKALGTVMRSTPLYADGKVYLCTNTGIWYVLKPKGDGVEVLQQAAADATTRTTARRSCRMAASICRRRGDLLHRRRRTRSRAADPLPEPSEGTAGRGGREAGDGARLALRRAAEARRDAKIHGAAVQRPWPIPADRQARGSDVPRRRPRRSRRRRHVHGAEARGARRRRWCYCKVGELEGKARVRIVPPLPWQFDFNEGENLPITLDRRPRAVRASRSSTASRVAKKLDVLPTPADPNNKLGTRSHCSWARPT